MRLEEAMRDRRGLTFEGLVGRKNATPTPCGLLVKFGLIVVIGISMTSCAKTSWKEEVLLHDGSKVVVDRSQSYGGRHELTQSSPIKEQEITFSVPGNDRPITWKAEYDKAIGFVGLNPLALHVLDGVPYIVSEPNLCLSYNKWGRPNPPYVLFRYAGSWTRISLEELPSEFREHNLLIDTFNVKKRLATQRFISASAVKELNESLTQKQYKGIVREPIKIACEMMIYRDGIWLSQ